MVDRVGDSGTECAIDGGDAFPLPDRLGVAGPPDRLPTAKCWLRLLICSGLITSMNGDPDFGDVAPVYEERLAALTGVDGALMS